MKAQFFKNQQKNRLLLGLLVIVVVFGAQSCLIKALHPFYKPENLFYNPSVTGQWVSDGGEDNWDISRIDSIPAGIMEAKRKGVPFYLVRLIEDKKDTSFFKVHLFKLNNKMYADFFPLADSLPIEGFVGNHLVLSHSVARIKQLDSEKIIFSWLSEEWLSKIFKDRRIRIKHEVVYRQDSTMAPAIVITARTEDLQKFLIKYDNEAFDKKLDYHSEKDIQIELTRK